MIKSMLYITDTPVQSTITQCSYIVDHLHSKYGWYDQPLHDKLHCKLLELGTINHHTIKLHCRSLTLQIWWARPIITRQITLQITGSGP